MESQHDHDDVAQIIKAARKAANFGSQDSAAVALFNLEHAEYEDRERSKPPGKRSKEAEPKLESVKRKWTRWETGESMPKHDSCRLLAKLLSIPESDLKKERPRLRPRTPPAASPGSLQEQGFRSTSALILPGGSINVWPT